MIAEERRQSRSARDGFPRGGRAYASASLPKRLALACVDRGWFGLTPLETHLVICGFPRSGTTLLHLMFRNCFRGVLAFDKERNALGAAAHAWRNHRHMVTKRPNDVFAVDAIRSHYSTRSAAAKFIIMIRDPRDLLLSRHSSAPEGYYVSVERWRRVHDEVMRHREASDVRIVRFEDLVRSGDDVQQRLAAWLGWRPALPFSRFAERGAEGFETAALNGLRPPDASVIGKWRSGKHQGRIREIGTAIPDLSEVLASFEYEAASDPQYAPGLSESSSS